jgi:hypothetical protein
VQTFKRVISPFTKARTRWILGFQVRLVLRWEWLTLNPLRSPLPQTSHRLAINYTSFNFEGYYDLTLNNEVILTQAEWKKQGILPCFLNLSIRLHF